MSQEDHKHLITPTGELVLQDKKIQCLSKALLDGIAEKIFHLDLRNNEIQHLENSVISKLINLRTLDLRNNRMEILTEKVSCLIHLKVLKLDHNLLTALPLEVFSLPLSALSIGDNSLFTIPSQIAQVKTLIMLSISENQIKELPYELGNLDQLKVLHIHGNQFKALPTSFSSLLSLEELSLEWFRYTSPALTKIIKGHIGYPILSFLREICYKKFQDGTKNLTLLEFLQHFSESDFDLNKIDAREKSLIHTAVTCGDIGVLLGLIESGCDLDLIDIDGCSALVLALKEDNILAAKILVQAGARLDIGGGIYGSVLNLAVIKSEPWLVSTLLKSGIDINVTDSEGNSCLHHLMAVFKRHKHRNMLIANMIVEAGADKNKVNGENWAAVHIAARKGQTAVFRWIFLKNKELRKKGQETFNLNLLGGSHFWSPLHVASHSGHYKTVETLVAAGADVYIRNADGRTPRDTSKGDLAIYKLLSRVEKEHMKMIIKGQKKYVHHKDSEDGVEFGYKNLYEAYHMGRADLVEEILRDEKNVALKADAVYLLGLIKQRKATKVLMVTVQSEESLIKSEAFLALEAIKDLEYKANHSHMFIGPKLPRSSPMQMSLPTNISAYIEEETRIDTLLLM